MYKICQWEHQNWIKSPLREVTKLAWWGRGRRRGQGSGPQTEVTPHDARRLQQLFVPDLLPRSRDIVIVSSAPPSWSEAAPSCSQAAATSCPPVPAAQSWPARCPWRAGWCWVVLQLGVWGPQHYEGEMDQVLERVQLHELQAGLGRGQVENQHEEGMRSAGLGYAMHFSIKRLD